MNRRYITNEQIIQILNQNFVLTLLSAIMTIHIIILKYRNNKYDNNQKLLINDLKILEYKTYDLEKQLHKNFLSVHIKKFYIEKLIRESYECPICLDKVKENSNVFLTLCGHLFHHDCLNQAMSFRKKCPTCRRGIYLNNFKYETSDDSDTSDNEGIVVE
jgi:hypothetical protein